MIHQEQFEEFLHCCKTQSIKKIHLADVDLIVFPYSGDFGGIVIEFENEMYLLTSKYQVDIGDETIDEFCVTAMASLSDMPDEIKKYGIYKTLSFQENEAAFVTELVDERGYFCGLELKTKHYFLFLNVSTPIIIVCAAEDEDLKYFLCPHQFGEEPETKQKIEASEYSVLFPEG